MKDEGIVIAAVADLGLLLLQDRKLTSAVGIITDEVVVGSWWSHPQADWIYAVLEKAAEHPDVLVTKLVSGKVTFIHHALWPAFLAVATSRGAWQIEGLTKDAEKLLGILDEGHAVEPAGAGAKEIELRLLAHAAKVHTASGKHVTRLEPWSAWASRSKCVSVEIAEAKRQLEAATVRLGGAPGLLPWHRGRRMIK